MNAIARPTDWFNIFDDDWTTIDEALQKELGKLEKQIRTELLTIDIIPARDDWTTIDEALKKDLNKLEEQIRTELLTIDIIPAQPDPDIWWNLDLTNIPDLTDYVVVDGWCNLEEPEEIYQVIDDWCDLEKPELTEETENTHNRMTSRFDTSVDFLEKSGKPAGYSLGSRNSENRKSVIGNFSTSEGSSLKTIKRLCSFLLFEFQISPLVLALT